MPHLVYIEDPFYGCWLWIGPVNAAGYPHIWLSRGVGEAAYRWAWEQENGPLQANLELDHLCRRIRCVRPCHLEPVTRHENERRKNYKYRNRQTHCARGHDLFTNGRRTPEAGFVCLKCMGWKA